MPPLPASIALGKFCQNSRIVAARRVEPRRSSTTGVARLPSRSDDGLVAR